MILAWLLMPIAGGLGAYARYKTDTALQGILRKRGLIPMEAPATFVGMSAVSWPILVINIIGSFLAGLAVGPLWGSPAWLVIGTGFLGGWTTFSTAMNDLYAILNHPDKQARGKGVVAATVIAFGGMAICVLAALGGMAITGM